MTDLDDRPDPMLSARLSRHLERTADVVAVRSTPVTTILRRADRRRRNRRLAAVLAAGSLIVLSASTVFVDRSRDRTIVSVDEPTTGSTIETTLVATTETVASSATPTDQNSAEATAPMSTVSALPSSFVDTPYEWTTITPDDDTRTALATMVSSSANDRGTLGWTYDESSPPDWRSAVYVSDDGITWSATPTDPGLSVVGGITDAGTIHVVGYASSDDPDAGRVFVATSVDRGATWRRDALPFDLSPAWDSENLSVRLYPSEMAVVDDTIVVAIQPTSMLLPQALGDSYLTQGFVYVPEGVALLRSCDGCPVGGPLSQFDAADIERVIPWADLGMGPEQVALLNAAPSVHVGGPSGYEEIDVPFAESPSGFWLTSTPTTVLAVEQRLEPSIDGLLGAPARLYETSDGRSWRLIGEVPLQTGRAGRIDGRYVVVGAGRESGDPWIVSSADGVIWTAHTLPDDATDSSWSPMWDMYAFDGDTLAMAGFEMLEPPELRLSENGVTMVFDAGLNDMQFIDDATGEEIAGAKAGERYGPVRLDEGPGDGNRTLSVLDDAGNVRAQFSLEEATAAMQATTGPVPRVAVYTTSDLTTWSRTVISDVVTDGNFEMNGIDLVEGQVVVRIGVDRDGDPSTFDAEPRLIVGTPVP